MLAARIFRPIRRRFSKAIKAGSPVAAAADSLPESRVGKQPVTNISPPGAPISSLVPKLPGPPLPTTREEGWLALLEMVFEVTGWPDAE